MTHVTEFDKTFTFRSRTFRYDELTLNYTAQVENTVTVDTGVFTRIAGKKLPIYIFKGTLTIDDLSFTRGIINSYTGTVGTLEYEGATVENVVLLSGMISFGKDHRLGQVIFRFGGLTDGMYSKAGN